MSTRSGTEAAELVELVGPARKGDRAAFDEIVRRTYDDTYTLAYRLTGDPDDAGDVAQEAYIRAYRHLRRFRGEARFTTWLYRITANCAATHMGRRKRHQHDELTDESPIADAHPDNDPELRADAAALRADVQAALRRLPERLRAVVVLRDVYDLSHRAIADELGISETAAKVRLHRARHKLRELVFDWRHGSDEADEADEPAESMGASHAV
ncbi:MAG: RNA polymerase sigma factor [Acidimicrobiales bacterium]